MKRLTLLPTVFDALLIFEDGTARPPHVELRDADVMALRQMCDEYLDWRRKLRATESEAVVIEEAPC